MNDKERLEEISKNTWIHVHPGKETTAELPKRHFEYLHEQAKLVQELESSRKTLSDSYFEQIEQYKHLLQQNKSYRELVNQIISIMSHPYSKTWNKDKTLYKLDIILRAYVQELESEFE